MGKSPKLSPEQAESNRWAQVYAASYVKAALLEHPHSITGFRSVRQVIINGGRIELATRATSYIEFDTSVKQTGPRYELTVDASWPTAENVALWIVQFQLANPGKRDQFTQLIGNAEFKHGPTIPVKDFLAAIRVLGVNLDQQDRDHVSEVPFDKLLP